MTSKVLRVFCKPLQWSTVCALFSGFLLVSVAETALAVPVMWGTDEDTGHLVRVENYDSTPLVTDYGKLSINDGGTIRPFPDTDDSASWRYSDIESFTLDDNGVAFMVGNTTIALDDGGTYSSPHLYSVRILNPDGTEAVQIDDAAASGGYNAVASIGALSGLDEDDPVNGIDFDPESGLLFGVVENGGRDDLIVINPVTLEVTEIKISMDGTNDIEDIQFDDQGNLYLIDDDVGDLIEGSEDDGDATYGDVLHRAVLDRSGPVPVFESIEAVNNTGDDHRIEALAWDFQNGKLIAFSDESNSLFQLSTTSDGFTNLGGVGFNDIEGMDFVPTLTGLPDPLGGGAGGEPIPEPGTLVLLGLGATAAGLAKRRRQKRAAA